MVAKTITCNKSNWSGEEISVEVRDGEFELFGCRFKLVERPVGSMVADIIVYQAELVSLAGNWDYPLVKVYRWTDDANYYAKSSGGYIEREDKNLLAAVIQVLCNII